jgi:hypothetical protein
MRKPGPNGLRAKFIKFCPLGLPTGVFLIHKPLHDCVDLQFLHFGHQLEALDKLYGAHLGRHSVIVKVGRSAAIRVAVPKVDPMLPFEPQEQSVVAAICIAQERLEWIKHLLWYHMVDHPGYRLI